MPKGLREAGWFLELLSTECPYVSVHQLGVDVATLWLHHGCPWSIGCRVPGLKSETWGTLRVFPTRCVQIQPRTGRVRKKKGPPEGRPFSSHGINAIGLQCWRR